MVAFSGPPEAVGLLKYVRSENEPRSIFKSDFYKNYNNNYNNNMVGSIMRLSIACVTQKLKSGCVKEPPLEAP